MEKKHQIWYGNPMKLNNEGWNCKKIKIIKKRTENKRICNHKNEGSNSIKNNELKSNNYGLNWKIKSNQKKIKAK